MCTRKKRRGGKERRESKEAKKSPANCCPSGLLELLRVTDLGAVNRDYQAFLTAVLELTTLITKRKTWPDDGCLSESWHLFFHCVVFSFFSLVIYKCILLIRICEWESVFFLLSYLTSLNNPVKPFSAVLRLLLLHLFCLRPENSSRTTGFLRRRRRNTRTLFFWHFVYCRCCAS